MKNWYKAFIYAAVLLCLSGCAKMFFPLEFLFGDKAVREVTVGVGESASIQFAGIRPEDDEFNFSIDVIQGKEFIEVEKVGGNIVVNGIAPGDALIKAVTEDGDDSEITIKVRYKFTRMTITTSSFARFPVRGVLYMSNYPTGQDGSAQIYLLAYDEEGSLLSTAQSTMTVSSDGESLFVHMDFDDGWDFKVDLPANILAAPAQIAAQLGIDTMVDYSMPAKSSAKAAEVVPPDQVRFYSLTSREGEFFIAENPEHVYLMSAPSE